ncbi:MAG: ABC transporter ATP-binding protein [Cyclobacteriaceae bacterium]
MAKIVLHTEDLTVGYRNKKEVKELIKDINVSLKSGELVCLLGQNGVGKSSLLRTLLDLQPALSGNVFLLDKELTEYSSLDVAKRVSLVLTDPIQTGNLTVTELVALGRSPYTAWTGQLSTEDREKVQWAIDSTRINYIEKKRLYELSDGQLQKALIARAIAQEGELIILDEPTAHLDMNNRVEIMQLLKELTKTTGKAILVATHELQLTLQLADQLWLTNFNQPLISGTPEDLALSGKLEETYYHEGFEFDIKTGRVALAVKGETPVVLTGEGDWHYWTTNMLQRIGFFISENAELKISQTTEGFWQAEYPEGIKEFESIQELAAWLRSQKETPMRVHGG